MKMPVPAATAGASTAQGDIKPGETVTVLVNGVPHEMKVDAPALNSNAGHTLKLGSIIDTDG